MQRKITILLTLCVLVFSTLFIALDANFLSSKRVHVTNGDIHSEHIPLSLDNVSVMVVSDLEYGTYMNKERLDHIVDTINTIAPDIVLFLGDLFDENLLPNVHQEQEVIDSLIKISAPLGKFAVTGDFDEANKEKVIQILETSQFEVINNKVMRLHNLSETYINLVGISQTVTQANDCTSLFNDLGINQFTIAICHNSDIVDSIPPGGADIIFCGNSHGAQIRFPIYGPIRETPGNTNYIAGLYTVGSTTLHVSHGLGTTRQDVRLFSDPELLFYRLHTIQTNE
ncbi:MAG: metallophosphoesterase [Erysipelotrichaceae bacterium]|nr:metallophosphoesterase [Erysipelotrichaceae bacterium]